MTQWIAALCRHQQADRLNAKLPSGANGIGDDFSIYREWSIRTSRWSCDLDSILNLTIQYTRRLPISMVCSSQPQLRGHGGATSCMASAQLLVTASRCAKIGVDGADAAGLQAPAAFCQQADI